MVGKGKERVNSEHSEGTWLVQGKRRPLHSFPLFSTQNRYLGISGSNQTRYPSFFCLRGIEVFLFSHAMYSNVGLCNNMVD